MKKTFLFCVALAFVFVGLTSVARSAASGPAMMNAAMTPTVVPAGSVKWTPYPQMKGVSTAVLYGDPTKTGVYVMRYKLDNGVKFPAHWHTNTEQVTILSGTFLVGLGDTWNAAKMTALPAGSFVSIPPNLHHYAQSKGEVILQITGMGPESMNMVKATK